MTNESPPENEREVQEPDVIEPKRKAPPVADPALPPSPRTLRNVMRQRRVIS